MMNVRNTVLAASFVIGCAVTGALASAPPAVFFSDLASGPNRGGKNDQGVFVTVVGKNFGAAQGGGYVTVGGGKAAEYPVWSDTKISFQVGAQAASGEIKVVTANGTSNGVPFTVRPGNIYFVDDTSPASPGAGTFESPWRSPASFYSAARAGDTCYFREGTYSGTYGDGGANFNFGSGAAQGAVNNEIAYVGYPGERAYVSGDVNFMFGYSKNGYVIAGFTMYGNAKCVGLDGTNIRIINNKLEGLKTSAYGIIHPVIGDGFKVYGNEIFGATSGNKKDHPIYVGYGSDNVDIGWNWFHDNNVAEGPVISVNTDYAVTEHYQFVNIRIHDNLMDCNGARGIGVIATDYGSSVYVYNNVIQNASGYGIYQYSASTYIHNNLFRNLSGQAIYMRTVLDAGNYYKPETVEIKNNIFAVASGGSYLGIDNESEIGSITVANNAYSGAGNGPARDASAVNADPGLVNPSAGDFHLQANSPLVNKGYDTSAVVKTDKDGIARPQGPATDIGPFEYFAGTPAAGTGSGTDTGTGPGNTATNDQPPIVANDGSTSGGGSSTGMTVGSLVRAGEVRVVGAKDGLGTVNPDKGHVAQICFKGSGAGRFECRVFALTGQLVWEGEKNGVSEGIFEWSPRNIAAGIYVAHVKGPGLNAKGKIAVMR